MKRKLTALLLTLLMVLALAGMLVRAARTSRSRGPARQRG